MAIKTTTAAELLKDYEELDYVPYAIVNESTGGYAVIENEIYETSEGGFIHIEVEMGVLRLPLDEDSEPITVAETRGDAVRLDR